MNISLYIHLYLHFGAHSCLSFGFRVGGCDEVVQEDLLVNVVDIAGEFGGFIQVAKHVGRCVGTHLEQSVIVQVLSDFNDGLPFQFAEVVGDPTTGFVVFYQHANHVAARCSS